MAADDAISADSLRGLVGDDAFYSEKFLQSYNPKTEGNGELITISYELAIQSFFAGKGGGDLKLAVLSQDKTLCTQVGGRIDYLLTSPFDSLSDAEKPSNDKAAIAGIIKTDEQPAFLNDRELFEAILVYRIMYIIY